MMMVIMMNDVDDYDECDYDDSKCVCWSTAESGCKWMRANENIRGATYRCYMHR